MSETALLYHRAVAALGLLVMVFLAWLMSSHRRNFPWRVVVGGLATQLIVAIVISKN